MKHEQASEVKPTPDAYDLALAQERQSWIALHNLQRTDPGYAAALTRWRDAADSIGMAAEQLLKRSSPGSPLGFRNPKAAVKMASPVPGM